MVYQNILEAVGHTPLVRLQRIPSQDCARILVKFEATNVGGSIKTRTALQMIQAAQRRGDLRPDSIIVEPTSGNQGIGLALVAAVLGYRAKIIMPDSVSVERRKLVVHYGADVLLEHDDGDIGACVERCIQRAERMARQDPRVYVPQQFENRDNLAAQAEHTAAEILADVDSAIDGFCSGVGTGGTITGIGRVLKEANPNVRIWAVEPQNAAILSGGAVGTHLQMGIGDGIVPAILDTSVYEDICIVTDIEAMEMSRRLAREEGLMCGISSGTNVVAAVRLARELGPGKTVVTVLPDTGERYISTKLFCGEEGLTF
ncbi:MAG: cysteine synthase A [Coriobacteriales bacterium]|nr:cysteine synthase A [Coriobacteriales bacterium]